MKNPAKGGVLTCGGEVKLTVAVEDHPVGVLP